MSDGRVVFEGVTELRLLDELLEEAESLFYREQQDVSESLGMMDASSESHRIDSYLDELNRLGELVVAAGAFRYSIQGALDVSEANP